MSELFCAEHEWDEPGNPDTYCIQCGNTEQVIDCVDSLITDRDGLVRYVRASHRAFNKHAGFLYAHGYRDLTDPDAKEAYNVLSQELRDAISKESQDEAEI